MAMRDRMVACDAVGRPEDPAGSIPQPEKGDGVTGRKEAVVWCLVRGACWSLSARAKVAGARVIVCLLNSSTLLTSLRCCSYSSTRSNRHHALRCADRAVHWHHSFHVRGRYQQSRAPNCQQPLISDSTRPECNLFHCCHPLSAQPPTHVLRR